MTDGLVVWLRTQLDEDERIAQAAASSHFYDCEPSDCIDHHQRWDDERVLAEVDAKRRILDCFIGPTGELTGTVVYGGAQASAAYFLKLLALPYADREGYRPEWRP